MQIDTSQNSPIDEKELEGIQIDSINYVSNKNQVRWIQAQKYLADFEQGKSYEGGKKYYDQLQKEIS